MPIPQKLITSAAVNNAKFAKFNGTDVLVNRCTFQEYKMNYNITSDEWDDLDKGYEILYDFGIVFIPEIMIEDLLDIED